MYAILACCQQSLVSTFRSSAHSSERSLRVYSSLFQRHEIKAGLTSIIDAYGTLRRRAPPGSLVYRFLLVVVAGYRAWASRYTVTGPTGFLQEASSKIHEGDNSLSFAAKLARCKQVGVYTNRTPATQRRYWDVNREKIISCQQMTRLYTVYRGR